MNIASFSNTSIIGDVAAAMAEERIVFLAQRVCAAAVPERELYRECLVRMLDQEGCVQGPASFVPQLESSGHICMLDLHMINLAFEELSKTNDYSLGCNVSTVTMQNKNSWDVLRSAIIRHRYLAERLVIEVTETRPISDLSGLAQNIADARALGCRVAIDDFGSGFISPAVLLNLEIDIVKIDASILRTIRPGKLGSSLRNLVGFATTITPTIVIEGVESGEDLKNVVAAGATHAQGYYLGRPVPGLALMHSTHGRSVNSFGRS